MNDFELETIFGILCKIVPQFMSIRSADLVRIDKQSVHVGMIWGFGKHNVLVSPILILRRSNLARVIPISFFCVSDCRVPFQSRIR